MGYKIGLFGTHGTGKTTLVHDITAGLQKHDLEVKTITEVAKVAKERTFPINQNTTLEAQAWILYRQCSAELEGELYGYDVTACDRTVFDNYCYLHRTVGENPLYLEMILNHAKIHPYDRLYYTPIIGKLNPKGRAADLRFQQEIDQLILNFFNQHNIKHIPLPPDRRSDWVDIIVSQTLKDLKRNKDG